MKTPRLWDFEKVDGKWTAKVSGKFLFYMHETMGFPVEIVIEEVNNASKKNLVLSQLVSWREFVKEQNINLDQVRKNNIKNKDVGIPFIKKIFVV